MNVKIDEYNINGTYPSNFLFLVDKIPKTVFALKTFPLPSVTSTPAETPYPNINTKAPGDTLTFGELSCDVFIDEYWANHKEIWNWHYNNVMGVNTEFGDIYSDGILLLYNNSLKIVVVEVKFKNLHPIGFPSELSLDNINTDEFFFTAGFVYDSYVPVYKKLD